MNNNFSDGRIPNAQYRDPGLDEYRNNPLICALPPVYSLNEVVAGLKIYPHFDDKEIYLDDRLRVHAIARILPNSDNKCDSHGLA